MSGIKNVSTPVAERAVAELIETAPISVKVLRRVVVIRDMRQPGVPVHVRRLLLFGERGLDLFDIASPLMPAP